jgi:Domain of unknown function (DUF4417)
MKAIRPVSEPARIFQFPQQLWDNDAYSSLSIGCNNCPEFSLCGGIHVKATLFDCTDLCSCRDKLKCDMICRFNPSHFVQRVREVNGFELGTIPRTEAVGLPEFPNMIPFVGHGYKRNEILTQPAVAISLYELIDLNTGTLRVSSHKELCARFKIQSDALIIASGVDKDSRVEAWWQFANKDLLSALKSISINLITVPNFSVLTDVPRWDNLHSIKRIALAWYQLSQAGIPAALHLNARTNADYDRWLSFIRERSEIQSLSFEFATGCGYEGRINWHVQQLCRIADGSPQPLTLFVRGGARAVSILDKHFSKVVLIDTDPFYKAVRRRKAIMSDSGRVKWIPSLTPKGTPIDGLLAHNIATLHKASARRLTLAGRKPGRSADYANGQSSEVSLSG